MSTSFSKKCEILGDVYLESGWNEELAEFRKYNDIGLPLAYMIQNKFIEVDGITDAGKDVVTETWDLLCEAVGVNSEDEFQGTDDMMEKAGWTDNDEAGEKE